MDIIPVIDILRGQAVHALRGQRQNYQALCSSLCEGSEPDNIIQAFNKIYPFKTIYIADLDAIQNQANNWETIKALQQKYSDLIFWIDQGDTSPTDLRKVKNIQQVVGSETGIGPDALLRLRRASTNIILSLDYQSDGLIGQPSLLGRPESWPEQVIVMSLGRVGTHQGPDYSRLKQVKTIAGDRRVYAAGGVRNSNDLARLERMGIAGALIASALHSQAISTEIIARFLKK